MRALWSGMISFGLVNIPVKLYTAIVSKPLEMNYLRKDDMCPIEYKRVCRRTGEEVAFDRIVRGYQYRKGDYVVLSEEDFAKADVKKSYTVDIEAFVDAQEVDVKFIEKPYFLEPDKKSQKAYALFRDAMLKSKKVGIGRFVLKDREHLVMLKPEKEVILLVLLRFSSLLKKHAELDLPSMSVSVPQNQMDLAMELIGKLEKKFKPEEFKDTYAERLKEIIEAKKKGKTVHIEEFKGEPTAADDILADLKKSLAAHK